MNIGDSVVYRGLSWDVVSFTHVVVCIWNSEHKSIQFVIRIKLNKHKLVSNLWEYGNEVKRKRPDGSLGQRTDENQQEFQFNRGLHDTGEQTE